MGSFELKILEIFTIAFLLKTIIWTWIFFMYCRILSLKTKKIFSKKMQTTYKLCEIARDRGKALKKVKEKRKMGKTQRTTIVFYFYFFIQKNLYFVKKCIWKNLVCIVTFVLQFFWVAGCWKFSNKTPAPIQICVGLVDAVLESKILGNRLGIVP